MKKSIILYTTIMILALSAALLIFTCPEREDHDVALRNAISEVYKSHISGSEDQSGAMKYLSFMGSLILDHFADSFIKNHVTFNDYYLFSTSEAEFKGKERIIAFGILGKIYTFDEDDLEEAVSEE